MHTKKILPLLLILALCLGLCSLFTGCDSTPGERVTAVKSVVDQATAVSQSVNSSIADVNQTIAALEMLLNDPNIPAESKPQIQYALYTARAKLNALIPQKAKVDAVLLQAQTILNSVDTNNLTPKKELSTYGAMTTLAAPQLPPPISGYIYLAGLLIPVVGGLIGKILLQIQKIKQQTADINQLKKANTEVVVSVDKLLNPAENNGIIPADKVKDAKVILMSNQSGVTSDLVDAIHDPMQNTAPTK